MNHEINLTGYTASCNAADNMLCLGTAGSYGLEKLHVTADAAWDGLTITATFTNSGSTTVAVTDGAVDVPPEATRLPTRDRVRYGQIAFKGADADGSIRLISTPVYYKVQASSATDGENTIAPTPDQYAQFVAEVTAEADRAEAAANRAESAGSTVTPEQIAEAVNSYLDENPVQPTAIDATLTQSGQAADAAAVGDRLSALSEEIAAIPSGKDGADGKSAYQYAQDGGYTGTETEFAEKMAQEKFANPNALTFTGAVTGSYDGSAPLSVEIPSGGDGSGGAVSWKLIRTINIVSGTPSYSFDTDNNGNAFKVKNFLILIDAYPATGGYLEIKPNDNFSFIQRPAGKQNYPFSFMMKRLTDMRYILENSISNQSTFERKISGEYSSFGEFTSFSFWFSAGAASDTTMYILGEDV